MPSVRRDGEYKEKNMPGSKRVFEKYVSNYFIETGCYLGDGIQSALDSGFKNIVSIEISEEYCNICRNRFKNNPSVKIVQGDSYSDLFKLIENIDCKMTFWLDGHWFGEGTPISKSNKISPILEELDQIRLHHIKNHTILIDDMRCWLKDNPRIGFGSNEIIEKIYEINKNYVIGYEDTIGIANDDILVAQVR